MKTSTIIFRIIERCMEGFAFAISYQTFRIYFYEQGIPLHKPDKACFKRMDEWVFHTDYINTVNFQLTSSSVLNFLMVKKAPKILFLLVTGSINCRPALSYNFFFLIGESIHQFLDRLKTNARLLRYLNHGIFINGQLRCG